MGIYYHHLCKDEVEEVLWDYLLFHKHSNILELSDLERYIGESAEKKRESCQ